MPPSLKDQAPAETKPEQALCKGHGDGGTKHSAKVTFVEAICHEVGLDIGREIIFHEDVRAVSKQWLHGGALGIGESYMAGSWAEGPEATLDFVWGKMTQLPSDKMKRLCSEHMGWIKLAISVVFGPPRQSISKAKTLEHYNVGNEFFRHWLDENMIYSCGYWPGMEAPGKDKHPEAVRAALGKAQLAKLELVTQKSGVSKGSTVLDIGCGWGALLEHLESKYGAKGTGITISKPQAELCRARSGGNLEVFVQDYREHVRKHYYDAIVSVGMIEHVGLAQLEKFFSGAVAHNLKEGGTAVIQWIGGSVIGASRENAWIDKYIFPNGETPSLAEVLAAAEKSRLIVEDVQNFGPDYEKTLLCWLRLFEKMTDEELCETVIGKCSSSYDENKDIVVFRRMWRYYLAWCSVIFRVRKVHLYQIVLRKPVSHSRRYDDPLGRYDAPR